MCWVVLFLTSSGVRRPITGTMRAESFKVVCAVLLMSVGCHAVTTPPAVCQNGFYGPQCASTCGHCSGAAPCDKVTGACVACAPGYNFTADPKCTVVCDSGTYGSSCTGVCSIHCSTPQICNHVTGSCTPCQAGWTGSQCTSACHDHKYGSQCAQSCGKCSQNAVCNKVNGHCPGRCEPGYEYDPTDPLCDKECAVNKWGQDCSGTCGAQCITQGSRHCDKVTGHCPCRQGYKVPFCDEGCDGGSWGQDCRETCGAHCTDVCDKINGVCTCEPGYQPNRCTDECTGGRYGQNCVNTCGFCDGGSTICNHVNGNCSRCQDNREMPLCKDCIAGHWGPMCGQRCGHCGGDGKCHPVHGSCLSSDCLDGWTSPTCDVKCSEGSYGKDCALSCGNCRDKSPCRHDTGICEQDCEDGYTGVLCKVEEESLVGPIVGSVLGAGVLTAVAIVVVAVCYFKRVSTSGPQKPKKDFIDIHQTDNGSNQHEALSLRDSQVYQNVSETSGGAPGHSNYDQTNFARQDSHAYAAHTPGQPPAHGNPSHHTYQNTARASPSSDAALPKRNERGELMTEPEPKYGNLPSLQAPEATYGNVPPKSGGRGKY